mmetsp:Transcript_22376/g.36134  ORF Transcript_22376/g.36134 Transcript_22376/m.36134 type:complete len:351 (-) Transcript_22376:410-1462(-)
MALISLSLGSSASALVPRASSSRRESAKTVRRPAALGAKPAFVARRGNDAASPKLSGCGRISHHLIVRAVGGEVDPSEEEENARRTVDATVDAEVMFNDVDADGVDMEAVEDDEDDEDSEAAEIEEERAPARLSRSGELLVELRAAMDSGDAADVLARVLPELTIEEAEMSEGFGNLKAANVGLEDQAGALKDQYLRLNADFDNYKKRTLKEKEQLAQTSKIKLFQSMLPPLDNFDLAKANLKTETEGEAKISAQYQNLFDGLMTILSAQGLSMVEGVGAAFDPNFHEAIMREETDAYPENTVIEEFRKGYKMGADTLIRAAMVKVSMEVSVPTLSEDSEEDAKASEETD